MLLDAADHLQSAIDLLDAAAAPGHIAAHADLGLQQLKDIIATAPRAMDACPDPIGEAPRSARTS
jgi:hypothetical protein